MSIQPKESSGGSGETRESVVFRMADEMLEKLPGNFLPHEVSFSLVAHCLTLLHFLQKKVVRELLIDNVMQG